MTRRSVRVFLTPEFVKTGDLEGTACLVVDVLRATSVVAAALANGASGVHMATSVEEAREVAARHGALLGGERGAEMIPGFNLGNSPREYTAERVAGRQIVLTTTNGSLAVRRSVAAPWLGTAALLNLGAAADAAWRTPHRLAVVCAGTNGRMSLEDALCAGGIVARWLCEDPTLDLDDAAIACRDLFRWRRADLPQAFQETHHGQHLTRLGLGADLELCSRVDAMTVAPVWDGSLLVAN